MSCFCVELRTAFKQGVMFMHTDTPGKPPPQSGIHRSELPRAARRILLVSAALIAGLAVAAPAHAAQSAVTQARVTQISAHPYTPADAPSAAHATEVDPDTFA